MTLPLQTATWSPLAEGAPLVVTLDQESAPELYLPPVFSQFVPSYPPQTIISEPDQTAVCDCRPLGAPLLVTEVQLFDEGV